MDLRPTRLIGRAEEVSLLEDALVELDQGRWAALELVGEPGIGKSRLLAELRDKAEDRGLLVLSGSASELERDIPFWIFASALDDYVRSLDQSRLELLDAEVRLELAHVLPSLSIHPPDADSKQQHERYRTHRAVRELLERLTATVPLVLLLDDVHWADGASVELLGALLRHPPDAPVLLAFTVRPQQVQERLAVALELAYRSATVTRVPLEGLTLSEARDLFGEQINGAAVSALYQETGGNPFYLDQLHRSLGRGVEGAVLVSELTLSLNVPPAVAAALAQELALLSDRTRLVLQGAAVVGDPFDPELAAAAAATSESTVLAAVDELIALDVVRPTDVPRRFRFRHPLVRRAVYETSPAGWRLSAHERSAEALVARGAPPAERAHHVERAGRQGDATAVATLREAGEAAAHRAPVSAARWLSAALRLLRDDVPAEQRVELLLARAAALATYGRFADGRAALLECLSLVPSEAVALRVRVTTACAGIEHLLGRHQEAHDRLADALDQLEDAGSPEAIALMIELAVDGVYRMKFGHITAWAERALGIARQLGDQPLMATAAAVLAWGAGLSGDVAAAVEYCSEAETLVDGLSDRDLALRLDAAVHLAGAELYLDRFTAAGEHADRVIAVATTTGQPAFIPFAFSLLAWVRMLQGDLAAGGAMLDAAIEESRLLGNAQSLAGLLLNRSLTALAEGDLELAATAAQESVDLTRGMDDGLIPAATTLALAAARLETGGRGLRDAVELMCLRCGGPGLPLMPGGSFRAKWLELLTRCLLALGRRPEAKLASARAEATVGAMGDLRMARAMADRAAGIIALDAGDPALAARKGLSSAQAADAVGIPVEAALSRTLAGRALAQAGERERAVAELEKAAAAFHACGARNHRDAADLELRRLGRHVHRRTRPGANGGAGGGLETLTERERQVADLVVDRRTNPEIADALFLSPKTVETHLRHIFHKLHVTSRADVARTVEAAATDLSGAR